MDMVRRSVFCLGLVKFNSVGISISPNMSEPKAVVKPDDLAGIEQLEVQFDQIREGLAQSHRLTTLGMLASRIT